MSASTCGVTIITASEHTLRFLCSAGRAIRVGAWEVYVASGCDLLEENYTSFSLSLYGTTRVFLLESECKMVSAYPVCARAVRMVPYVILLQSPCDGSRPLDGAHSVSLLHLSLCHSFLLEEEPIFSFKSQDLINDGDTGLCVVAYTELFIPVCAPLLFSVYYDYCLWYVPSDIIRFISEICMAIEFPLRSWENAGKVLDMLEII